MAANARRLIPTGRHPRLAALALAVPAGLLVATGISADEGWRIDRFAIEMAIQPDGQIAVREALDVDFGTLRRHGIFRDIDYRFDYDATHIREFPIELTSVTSGSGQRYPVEVSSNGARRRFRIGDANRMISGRQQYRIAYRIRQALNGFPDHDELYWNVTGLWPVTIRQLSVTVEAPGPITEVHCFQGPAGSREPCDAKIVGRRATYTSTRVLPEGEQMTVVASLDKGTVPAPVAVLFLKTEPTTRPSTPMRLHARPPWAMPVMIGGVSVAVVGVLALWWRYGRDRRYLAWHQAGSGAEEERAPLFGARPIGVEFQPPDKIRPAQMGLILDERADTLDVTATIIDLAVRGYVKITEVPKAHWFSRVDWQLDRLKAPDAGLLDYERIVVNGLFGGGSSRKISELKNKFYKDLAKAKAALYDDAVARGWFPRSPEKVRAFWLVLGFLTIFGGIFLMISLGSVADLGPLGLPVAISGVLLLFVARVMPRRSAAGSEMLYRSLGFAKYLRTAETEMQAFAERAQIFTEYLPYAITLKCVDRWAQAFRDIDVQAATAGWYAGSTPFTPTNFSSSFSGFASAMSQSLASTPGSSGSSGSGGSSGGGGGGGGGGSW